MAQVLVRALAGDLDPPDVELELDVPRVGLLEQDVVDRRAVGERELDVVVVEVEVPEPVADGILTPHVERGRHLLIAIDGARRRI
jgi:hypothetical protein